MRKNNVILLVYVLVIVVILVIGGTYCYFNLFLDDEVFKNTDKKFEILDFTDISLKEVEEYAEAFGINLEIEYEYNSDIEKGMIISQNIMVGEEISKGDLVKVVVSKGVIPIEIYQKYKVNELGNVPIMMYHGIVDMLDKDTKYIGGNVDKEGYHRTVESFRDDLEFYYKSGYRMIRLIDYVNGNIEVDLGYSPIVLTFDDGSENNFRVLGEENGELVIDPNCAVGVLESFKKKYPDYGVTATFFVNGGLFQQNDYNEKILKWLVEHGYDVGNHTLDHVDFTKVDIETTKKEVGGLYQILNNIISERFVPIVALPFGSPYKQSHLNYNAILNGEYLGELYETKAILRVGWEAEVSCFDKSFDPHFMKRIRAYDNEGDDFDIEYNFSILESNRYISDGDKDAIVVLDEDKDKVLDNIKKVIIYK